MTQIQAVREKSFKLQKTLIQFTESYSKKVIWHYTKIITIYCGILKNQKYLRISKYLYAYVTNNGNISKCSCFIMKTCIKNLNFFKHNSIIHM